MTKIAKQQYCLDKTFTSNYSEFVKTETIKISCSVKSFKWYILFQGIVLSNLGVALLQFET